MIIQSDQDEGQSELEYKIQFPDGDILEMSSNKNEKISKISHQISQIPKHKPPPDKTITLIYMGRILNDDEKIGDVETFNGFTINCFFRTTPNEESNYIEPRGFDRLRRMGYEEDEIVHMREMFHREHGTGNDPEERLEAEEEWLPSLIASTNNENNLNIEPNNNLDRVLLEEEPHTENTRIITADISNIIIFVVGFFGGSFFGFIGAFFLVPIIERAPEVFANGMIAGILVRMILNDLFFGE